MLSSCFTLIIPTFNRPDRFQKLIKYLDREQFRFKIIVLDSSKPNIIVANQAVCKSSGLELSHLQYEEMMNPLEKLLDGIRRVNTEYAALCADDDIIFPDSLHECLEFLTSNPEYIACHGNYINFTDTMKTWAEYSGPSLDSDSVVTRIWQLMCNYEAINYAVFRTSILKQSFEMLVSQKGFSLLFSELFVCLSLLIRGQVKRLSNVYYARCASSGNAEDNRTNVHPMYYFANESEKLLHEYVIYRDQLISHVLKYHTDCNKYELIRLMDLIHYVYFTYSVDINHIIQTLNTELRTNLSVFTTKPITCVKPLHEADKSKGIPKFHLLGAIKEIESYFAL